MLLIHSRSAVLLASGLVVLGMPGSSHADAIIRSDAMNATTIAEFYVEDDGITVDLEIGAADLARFANLLPDGLYERFGHPPRAFAERLREFFEGDFAIRGPDGTPLRGAVLEIGPRPRVRRDPITGEAQSAENAEPDTVVFARLAYAFDGRPDALSFSAPRGTSVGFIVYHGGVAVNDFRYLGPPLPLDLDWQDPWYTSFRSRSLRRQYFAPMSGFIYVEPFEVRKEIILRPLDLQAFVDLGLEGRTTIPVEIQPELKRRVAAFLREHHPVEIDGRKVPAELARIHFLERTLRTSRVIDPPEELDIYSAVLGVIFVYPTEGLPERVTMEWDLWNDRLTEVPVSAVDQAGPLRSYLQADWRLLEWQNFLTNPELPTLTQVVAPPSGLERAARWLRWAALAATLLIVVSALRSGGGRFRVVAGSATLAATVALFWLARGAGVDEARGREVVSGLLHNVYRAFDYRDEEQVYDVLARSAAGDLLERIYLETRRGLVLAGQGGARAKVKEIELVDLAVEPGDSGAFIADVSWQVRGSVGHWGHVHQRTNRVRARLTVAPVEGAWKIADMLVLEEERL
jgi:hypothetical protein